jgi:hypothetical protein
MTIGDTYGLREKLENLNGVVSVNDYYTYEGNAFFTLILSENRLVKLGGVGNQDLVASDGIIIDQIGSIKIICKHSSGRAFSNGISTSKIEQNFPNEIALDNIDNLITHYNEMHAIFSKMPLKLYDLSSDRQLSSGSFITCNKR